MKENKRLRNIFKTAIRPLAVLLSLCFFGCDQDPACSEDSFFELDPYYLNINILDLSSLSTRTDNSQLSFLEGHKNENIISSITLYIFDDENDETILLLNSSPSPVKNNDGSYSFKFPVKIEQLKSFSGRKLNFYFVGNAWETQLNHNFGSTAEDKKNALYATFDISPEILSSVGIFSEHNLPIPIVSSRAYKLDLSSGIEYDSPNYSDVQITEAFIKSKFINHIWNIFPGKKIQMERALARIDYKDKERNSNENPFTYKIGTSDINIKLKAIQPFNINKKCYLFRHTVNGSIQSAFDLNNKPGIFGDEGPDSEGNFNWIANPDWNFEEAVKQPEFINNLTIDEKAGIWHIDDISEKIIINELITRDLQDGYHPLCYLAENTIPMTEMMTYNILPNYATGIAFYFNILDKKGNPLNRTSAEDELPEGVTLKNDKILSITIGNRNIHLTTDPEDNDEYQLIYFGFIMHDPDRNSIVAPMEYGVVRNNVYQLSIESVSNLPDYSSTADIISSIKLNISVSDWEYDDKYTEDW